MSRYFRKIQILFFVLMLLFGGHLTAENEMLIIKGFRVTHELVLPGDPNQIYKAITGDISGWWDHSFSEKPVKFYIEAKPGGGFFEIFNDNGDGVKHATVTAAQEGKLLRFEGPLGLSGNAIHMVHTYKFTAVGPDSTKLNLTVNAIGEVNKKSAEVVDKVWYHFLFEQFEPYMKNLIAADKE